MELKRIWREATELRLPRVRLSLKWMMVAVAITALDCSLLREVYTSSAHSCIGQEIVLPAFTFIPPLSLLGMTAASAGLGLLKRGRVEAFATGYLLTGTLATLGLSIAYIMRDPVWAYLELLESIWDRLPSGEGSYYTVVTLALMFPQIVAGLAGGGWAARHGLTIVMTSRLRPRNGSKSGSIGISASFDEAASRN